jgi:hypothetical protein
MGLAMNKTYQVRRTAPEFLLQARVATGIDIVDAAITQKLEYLLKSLNTEAQLHEAGARAWERLLHMALCNRLRMLRDVRNHPEIAEERIERPLIMSGTARSGSTKIHKKLAAGGDFLYMPAWQGLSMSLLTGDRNENPAERIRTASEHIDWFNTQSPTARLTHELSTFEPEEENLLQAHNLSPYLQSFSFIPQYLDWYAANVDWVEDFRFLKLALQYLQWQFHPGENKPWILKSPTHFGFEPWLVKVFPDAYFISTVRDPLATFGSSVSLLTHYYAAFTDVIRKDIIGPLYLERLAAWSELSLESRKGTPDLRILDLSYREIMRSSETVMEQIYSYIGMPLSERAREAMRVWETGNVQHKHGAHSYSLEDFGLTAETVRARFARYIAAIARLL